MYNQYDYVALADDAYELAMRRGSRWLLNAIGAATNRDELISAKDGFATSNLKWGMQKDYIEQVHPISPYKIKRMEKDARGLEEARQRKELAESLRVSRDPCPRCGVRGDIGCGHNT